MKPLSILLITLLLSVTSYAHSTNDNGVIHQSIKGQYFDVANSIRNSIIGKGIHIAHELNASSMLNRTGNAYGYQEQIYKHANILEFCSAKLSHLLSQLNPQNITACPFTISIYELKKQPGTIHIVYHTPSATKGAKKVVIQIESLIKDIIEEAIW